jgi:transcriptional regulator with XRE-family HTH domain
MSNATDNKAFRKQVSRAIAVLRQQIGWTQQDLADELGLVANTVAKWESGKHDMRLSTLWKLAYALRTSPAELLSLNPPEDAPRSARPPGPLIGLSKTGWRRTKRDTPGAIPVLDLRPEAGPGRSRDQPRAVDWAVHPSSHSREEGQFLARFVGNSMEPEFTDGQWLLFSERGAADDLLGKAVLVRTADVPDLAGWQVKRVTGVQVDDDGQRFLTLHSRNGAYPDRQVALDGSGDVAVVAVVKAALRAR